MKIVANGKVTEVAEGTSLQEFVLGRKTQAEGVIAELNEKVIRRDMWTGTVLADGDRLELVSLVGGG